MPTLERGTHRLRYEIRGREDAPPLLLIMGLGLSSRAWFTLPERLEHAFRVISFDNAGTGGSTLPATGADLPLPLPALAAGLALRWLLRRRRELESEGDDR